MEIASCSSCHRAIIWAISPNGARLPLDARPVTVYSIDSIEDGMPPAAVKTEHAASVYISHFLTCPSAAQHSRRATPAEQPPLMP